MLVSLGPPFSLRFLFLPLPTSMEKIPRGGPRICPRSWPSEPFHFSSVPLKCLLYLIILIIDRIDFKN